MDECRQAPLLTDLILTAYLPCKSTGGLARGEVARNVGEGLYFRGGSRGASLFQEGRK